jgi:hypothetical protein
MDNGVVSLWIKNGVYGNYNEQSNLTTSWDGDVQEYGTKEQNRKAKKV